MAATRACIIGAGSSGITAAQVLQANGIDFERHAIDVDFHVYRAELEKERRSGAVSTPAVAASSR